MLTITKAVAAVAVAAAVLAVAVDCIWILTSPETNSKTLRFSLWDIDRQEEIDDDEASDLLLLLLLLLF